MRRKSKLICVILAVVIAASCFTGCDPSPAYYYGPYVDLSTVAVSNIFGISNLWAGEILLMEKDDFGRQMFAYWGISNAVSSPGIIAICVSQKSAGKYVYYYPDDCFLLYARDRTGYVEGGDPARISQSWALMSAEDLNALKEKNDWGKPLDLSRCDKKTVSRTKSDPVSKEFKLAFYGAVGYLTVHDWVTGFYYLTSDSYNRHIYYSQINSDNYAVMFYPDGHFDYIKITDPLHYQDAMKAFKAQNNWNQPIP